MWRNVGTYDGIIKTLSVPPGLTWEDEQVSNKALSIVKFLSIIYFKMLCESKYNTKQSAHWNHNPLFILRGLVVPLWHKHAHHVWAITSYLFQELLWRGGHVDRAPMNRVFCSLCLSGEWSSCPAKFQQDVVTTDETGSTPLLLAETQHILRGENPTLRSCSQASGRKFRVVSWPKVKQTK